MATITVSGSYALNMSDPNLTLPLHTQSGKINTSTKLFLTDGGTNNVDVTGTGLSLSGGEPVGNITKCEFKAGTTLLWTVTGTAMDFNAYTDGFSGGDNIGTIYGMEAVLASWLSGSDTITGGAADDFLRGYGGSDSLNGLGGADLLAGGGGNDTLLGGLGNDQLRGGSGTNILNGEGGVDTVNYQDRTESLTVSLALTSAQTFNGGDTDTLLNIENAIGSIFADHITGSALANKLMGNEGYDTILGGGGNDILNGEEGKDTLTGGSGQDKFLFNTRVKMVGETPNSNIDTIKDFSVVDDGIQLDNAIFTKLGAAGALLAGYFRASTSGNAVDSNDYILYETDTGKLFYDADGSGAGVKVQFALIGLTTHAALTFADFSVV